MNTKLLAKIKALPDPQQCIKFFSHLINSQKKWMARIIQYPQDPKMDWGEPVYALDELKGEWRQSLQAWFEFIESKGIELSFHPSSRADATVHPAGGIGAGFS